MKLSIFLFLSVVVLQDQALPYKPDKEFTMILDYNFKERPAFSTGLEAKKAYDVSEVDVKRGGPLPYLIINFKLLALSPNEVKFKVVDNLGNTKMNNKKTQVGMTIKLDLGFTDDIKDKVTPFAYEIIFLNNDKVPSSFIRVEIKEDGTFFMNGEKRGLF